MNTKVYMGRAVSFSVKDLPPATKNTLGGVKVGGGLNVDVEGSVSVDTNTIATNRYVDESIAKAFETKPRIYTWTDVHHILQMGKARDYFKVGDQFTINRVIKAEFSSVDGLTGNVDNFQLFNKCTRQAENCTYTFKYVKVDTSYGWRLKGDTYSNVFITDLNNIGITLNQTQLVEGNTFEVKTTIEQKELVDIIDIDKDGVNTMTLMWHNGIIKGGIYPRFSLAELLIKAKTTLNAGTYNITLVKGSNSSTTDEDGTYQFTITKPIEVGGGIRHTKMGEWLSSYNQQHILGGKFITYDSKGNKLEEVATSLGNGGINLGTTTGLWKPNELIGTSASEVNCTQRQYYGNNNYYNSMIRAYINEENPKSLISNANKSTFNIFPYDWLKNGGLLYGLDPRLLEIIKVVPKKYGEYGKTEKPIVEDKMFLLSKTEVGGSDWYNKDTPQKDCYAMFSSDIGNEGDSPNRVRYFSTGGTCWLWWLRDATAWDSNTVARVHGRGALASNLAINDGGVLPAFVIH